MMDSNNLPRQSNGNAYHVVRIGTSSATPTGLGGEHGRFIPQVSNVRSFIINFTFMSKSATNC